ncbi:hypothetical protein SAMN05421749_10310 [Acinetobacter marinus]|uniref:Uncharacterized protein n=1 Tax=Acinetobacter marinus TaxID=281375 RepID=A0A1G6IED3_9GAMM|nr:hypothetical protein [Acinetobacter marinus]SDC04760.1 hypothetical protein SAMN05421749_10310 [Acinetobacter marinus]
MKALNYPVRLASKFNRAYSVDLSKSKSVTPQRHCGFIVPKICIGSQSMHIHSASVSATHTRLKSLYEGLTRQNKSAMANMSGGTFTPRVRPFTLISQVSVNHNSKVKGGNHA